LSFDERLELGVLSTGERTQPTLPGLEDVDNGDASGRTGSGSALGETQQQGVAE